jgi:hypothetical protein
MNDIAAAVENAKFRIAKDMFLHTADDNYLVARWCRFEGFNVDFSWLAVHALEKYMKAALLMNGYSSKGYSHDIVTLYTDVKAKIANGLLDKAFTKPPDWNRFWREETTEKYVERLYAVGNAHNRYEVYGYELEPEDLVKLDATVFGVRRLCQPLDRSILPRVTATTKRQTLEKQPGEWSIELGGRLEKAARNRNDKMHDILCCLNLAFAPPSYEQPNGTSGASMKRSALYKEIFRPSYNRREDCDYLDALVKWIDDNISLPKEAAQELRDKVKDAYAKLSTGAPPSSPPEHPPGQTLALVLGHDDAPGPPTDVGIDQVAEMGVVAASVADVAPDPPVPEEVGPEELATAVAGTHVGGDRDNSDPLVLGRLP